MRAASNSPDGETHIGGIPAERVAQAWLEANGFEVDRGKGVVAAFKPRDRHGRILVDKKGRPRTYSQKRDVFRCLDLIAMRDNLVWFLQVTTPNGRRLRKAKMERHRWPRKLIDAGSVRVSVITHGSIRNPVYFRGDRINFWRIDDIVPGLDGGWDWKKPETIRFSLDEIKRKKEVLAPEEKKAIEEEVRAKYTAGDETCPR